MVTDDESVGSARAVKAIWAQARDAQGRPVIGSEGTMPWHLPGDLRHFQELTKGGVVVMGRRTWESLPARFRPLPGRTNIVVTARDSLDGAVVAHSLRAALLAADAVAPGADVWLIGGAGIFAAALDVADALEITEIDLEVEGDTFAPTIDPAAWTVTATSEWSGDDSVASPPYRFVTFERAGR